MPYAIGARHTISVMAPLHFPGTNHVVRRRRRWTQIMERNRQLLLKVPMGMGTQLPRFALVAWFSSSSSASISVICGQEPPDCIFQSPERPRKEWLAPSCACPDRPFRCRATLSDRPRLLDKRADLMGPGKWFPVSSTSWPAAEAGKIREIDRSVNHPGCNLSHRGLLRGMIPSLFGNSCCLCSVVARKGRRAENRARLPKGSSCHEHRS